jgi:ankyrin repeat protein
VRWLPEIACVLSLSLLMGACSESGADSAMRTLDREGFENSDAGFYSAIISGNRRVVEAFLSLGVDPSSNDAIIFASHRGDYRIVRALLEAGADPNTLDEAGLSPLAYASLYASFSSDHLKIARVLVDSGADPELGTVSAVSVVRDNDIEDRQLLRLLSIDGR